VVVPTRDRADRLERLLRALSTQSITEPFEVVVVDDGSIDDTPDRLKALAADLPYHLDTLTTPTPTGPAGARNRGWRATTATNIAFIDDDCVPDPGWLATLLHTLDHDHDVVEGRTKPPPDQLHRIGPFSSYIDSDSAPLHAFLSCNIAYRRQVLEQLNGFDDARFPFPNGEDTDLGLRARQAGFSTTTNPKALVWHDVGPSEFATHMARVPRLDGMVALIAAHPEARRLLNAGWFLRSIDKAVLATWAGAVAFLLRPRSRGARLLPVLGVLLYLWQFDRNHYRSRSAGEWATSVPLGFVADSWALAILARSSLRHRTLLL
jgi:glycosyltransferase involved in cell wall biosynthesis